MSIYVHAHICYCCWLKVYLQVFEQMVSTLQSFPWPLYQARLSLKRNLLKKRMEL